MFFKMKNHYRNIFFMFFFVMNQANAAFDKSAQSAMVACDSVKNLRIPYSETPPKWMRKEFKECDNFSLYWGFKSEPDYLKSRYCAIVNPNLFILIMIYANGKGVEKNIDLATHLACSLDTSEYDVKRMVNDLVQRKTDAPKKDFETCDYASTMLCRIGCLGLNKKRELGQEKYYLKELTKNFTDKERELLQELK